MIRLRSNKGFGLRYIQQELTSKGISKSLIRDTLEEMHIDWYELADAVYQKKYALQTIKDNKDKAKRIRYLQYRGFAGDEILSVIDRIKIEQY